MLFLSLCLILIFDTLIRFEENSKLKSFWVKKFPESISKKIEVNFTRLKQKIRQKMIEKGKIPNEYSNQYNSINFLSLEDLITLIPSKYATKMFWVGLILFLIYISELIYTFIN